MSNGFEIIILFSLNFDNSLRGSKTCVAHFYVSIDLKLHNEFKSQKTHTSFSDDETNKKVVHVGKAQNQTKIYSKNPCSH